MLLSQGEVFGKHNLVTKSHVLLVRPRLHRAVRAPDSPLCGHIKMRWNC